MLPAVLTPLIDPLRVDHAWYEGRKEERLPATVENRYLCLTMARCCIQHQEYQKAYDLMGRLRPCGFQRQEGAVVASLL